MTRSLRFVLTVACAAGAGAHAGLIPSHLRERNPALVLAFAATAGGLAVLALVAGRPRFDGWAPATATAALCAVAVAYVLSRRSGLPGLVTAPEGLDTAGVVVTLTEALGAAAGVVLATRTRRQLS